MKKPDIWIAFDWPRFQADTAGLPAAVKWHYWTACCAYYYQGCIGLPDDDEILRGTCEVLEPANWARIKGLIFGRLFKLGADGLWHQKRAKEEYEKAQELMEKNQAKTAAATLARQAKHHDDNVTNDVTNDVTVSVTCVPSPSPSPLPTEPPTPIDPAPPVEPPPRFPKTEAEAVIHADFAGCPREFAATEWSLAMSRAGRDDKQVPISSWRHYLKARWDFSQNRKAEQQSTQQTVGRGDPFWKLSKQLELVEKEIQAIENRATHSALGMEVADKDRKRYFGLKQQRRNIKTKLGL